jgi:hypothetical protein
MTVPFPKEMSREDRIMLSLYYRWALQALSAIKFAHSRSVFFRNFCYKLVWLRSDFSLAITGFFCAAVRESKGHDDGKNAGKWKNYEPPFMEREPEISDEEYLASSWSDGELITDNSMDDDIWEGDDEYGFMKGDLSVLLTA